MTAISNQNQQDYKIVKQVIELISENWQEQPELTELAKTVGQSPTALQKLFTRWAGLSPKAFLLAVTMDHAKRLLAQDLPLLEASHELGLSGPGRLHDLFISHEAMTPGDYKAKGAGLKIRYGYHPSPFGIALVMITERGMAGLSFCDPDEEALAFDDMSSRWPKAEYIKDQMATEPFAKRSFDQASWKADDPLRIVMIGTDFEIRVWEGLLKIPFGKATTYGGLGEAIGTKAPRAIGGAVGRNPLSFVVPCHRVVGKSGALTGYHWGLTRKRAILGWESGMLQKS